MSSAIDDAADASLTSRDHHVGHIKTALIDLQSRDDYTDENVQKLLTQPSSAAGAGGFGAAQDRSNSSKHKLASRNNLNSGSVISGEHYFSSNA